MRRRRRGFMSQLFKSTVIGIVVILAIIGTMSLLDGSNNTDKTLETSTINNASVIEAPLSNNNPDNTKKTNIDEDRYKREQTVENDLTRTQEIESELTTEPVLEGEKITDGIETKLEPIKYSILKLRAINSENKKKLNANYVVYDKDEVKVAEISNVDKTSLRLPTGKYKVVTTLTQTDENTAQPSPVVQKSEFISVREHIISEQVFELEPLENMGISRVSAVNATDDNLAMSKNLIIQKEKFEQERLTAEKIKKERIETERLEAERQEEYKLGQEKLEKERLAAEKAEIERLEMERLEVERLKKEKIEQIRLEQERLAAEKVKKERIEAERLEAERQKEYNLEKEKLEKERLAAEKAEVERLEVERLELERLKKEKIEQERLAAEKIKKERIEAERLEAKRQKEYKLEKEKLEKERLAAEKAEVERLEVERLELERLKKEKIEQERLAAEKIKKERIEAERLEAKRQEDYKLGQVKLEEVKDIVTEDISDQYAQKLKDVKEIQKSEIGDRDTKKIEEAKDIVKNDIGNQDVKILEEVNDILKSDIGNRDTKRLKELMDVLKNDIGDQNTPKLKVVNDVKDIVKNDNNTNAIVRIFSRNKLDNQPLKSNIYIQTTTGKHLDKKINVEYAEFNLAPGVYKIAVRSKNREDMVKIIRVSSNKDINQTFLLKELLKPIKVKKPKSLEEVKNIVKIKKNPSVIVRIFARNELDNQLLTSNIYIQTSTGKQLDKRIYVEKAEFNLTPGVYKIVVKSKNRKDMVKIIRVSANKDINMNFFLKELLRASPIKKP